MIDISDPAIYGAGDAVATWAQLRATRPVFWNQPAGGEGFWAIMTYAPALQVYRDAATFTSEGGMRVGADRAAVEAAAGRMLIVSDPPHHTSLRQALNPAFRPAAVRALATSMRRAVEPLIEENLTRETVEFVSEVAAIIPAAVICDLMGVPESDRPMMIALTSRAFGASVAGETTGRPADMLDRAEAHAEIFLYYDDLVEERRRHPGDDLVSTLVHSEIDGRRLTNEEVLLNCDGLVTGANETTRHAFVGGLLALIENPDQWRGLREGTLDVDTAVEEVLRYTSPAMHVKRVVTADVELGGQLVEAGQAVAVWNPSVNRDEQIFPDPERFDLARRPNRHLTLGHGPHNCLGGLLARQELRILLEVLRERVTTMELVGPVRRLYSNFIWGFEQLPVRLR
ncbi:cytochrome P450 [Micromonospora orduensis]|uniref:Cytochrome P450 n=1 Tax=Micromonospora orduensis TaxID=1420891 RepID=A0A5C4QS91_9ACTN|nr:cytochrome P450 [Micromonospora orduensis]TNH29621.1 cytochrome P450 [Micromonospora orduensis]